MRAPKARAKIFGYAHWSIIADIYQKAEKKYK